jgi:hypothetical protein
LGDTCFRPVLGFRLFGIYGVFRDRCFGGRAFLGIQAVFEHNPGFRLFNGIRGFRGLVRIAHSIKKNKHNEQRESNRILSHHPLYPISIRGGRL